jgi:AraC family transcriptional regulator
VCWNYKPGSGFDYLSGVEVKAGAPLPSTLSQVRIPAGRYAVFTHRQHVSTIAQTLDAIWTKWLPNSGHPAADAPCFERYDERFDPRSGLGGFEIWVALKP